MKYRILQRNAQGVVVAADGGKPEQRYAHVTFAPTFTAGQAVGRVADYVQEVREATKLAKRTRVNAEVSHDN